MPEDYVPVNVEFPRDGTGEASAFAFLANLLPAINLTDDTSENERPFVARENNKTAKPRFDRIARQLHRQDAPHLVLTGPTGIGKTETVRELARRCRCGGYPFLADAALVWFDCSVVGPEDSRGCLETLLAVARDRAIKELRPLCLSVEEFIVRLGRIPTRSEMGILAREVERLYSHLPSDLRMWRISRY